MDQPTLRPTPRRDVQTLNLEVPTLQESSADSGSEAAFGRGRSVGRYLILRTLGIGGSGMVFLADDPELDRKVALKLLRSQGDRQAHDGQMQILAEAQAIARLSHPNVVSIYDVGSFEEGVFIAMEFVEGPSMRRWLEHERSLDAILDVMMVAGRGVAAAHDAGLVHRDIKPENILVADDGRTRVVDFGLAQLRSEPSLTASHRSWRSGEWEPSPDSRSDVMGTPRYMAPELFSSGDATPRSDQFAFCVTLFEAIYGMPPFAPLSGHRWMRDFSRLPTAGPESRSIPGALRAALERGLALDAEFRYRDMNELLAVLGRIRQRRRRRLTVVAAAAVMGAGIAIGLAPGQLQREGPCAHVTEGIDTAWNPQASASVARAFEATALPHAVQAASDVQQTLDRYADQWRGAREAACVATLVDGTQSGASMDLRVACLEQRRVHLRALVETLESADAAVVDNAAVAARSLPRIAQCDDERVLALLPPIPNDPEQRERVGELRERLAAVTAARQAGQFRTALELGERLQQRVSTLDYAPVVAEHELELGTIHARLGHHAKAEEHLRATLVAATRGRYEIVRGEAWFELARELSVGQKRFQAGEEAVRAAEASLAGRGEDPTTHERLLLLKADLARSRDDALRVESLLSGLLDRDDLVIERHELLAQLGAAAQLSGRATVLLDEALTLRIESLGPTHPRVADIQLLLSRSLADSEKFDEATAMAQRAYDIRTRLFEHDSVALAETISAKAYVEANLSHSEQAARLFEQAAEMIRNDPDHVDFDLAGAISNTGVMYSRLGRHAEARRLHEQAFEIYERADPDHPRLLLPLINTAAAYRREGVTDRAIEWTERAIAWMLQDPRPSYTTIDLELDVSELHMDAGRLDDARVYLERAEMRLEHMKGTRDTRNFHRPWQLRARLQLLEGRPDVALESIQESIRLYVSAKVSRREEPDLAWARFIYAQVLFAHGHQEEATEQAHAAVAGMVGDGLAWQRAKVITWLDEHALPAVPSAD